MAPLANDSNLALRHPTPDECNTIWTQTYHSWGDAFTLPEFLKENLFLMTVPLAEKGGLDIWILVDKSHAPGQREILCSCETLRKKSLVSGKNGDVVDSVVYGIASVFCAPQYRGQGYPGRMLKELSMEFRSYQGGILPIVGTILYSDIGKEYYAKLGWKPNETNSHVELRPEETQWPAAAHKILAYDLYELCKRDEALLRWDMAKPSEEIITRMTIIPNLDHILWHLSKEEFICQYLFSKIPTVKGAIAGSPGNQAWAVWTHRYYDHPDAESTNNVLYILRLVMEADKTATRLPSDANKRLPIKEYDEQLQLLTAILRAAQAEALKWKLDVIQLWDPTPLVRDMLSQSGLKYTTVEREKESIASLMWHQSTGIPDKKAPLWVNNEHYAWL